MITNEIKKKANLAMIEQIETRMYSNEVMGRTWTKFKNIEAAKQCAEAHAQDAKIVDELRAEIAALDAETVTSETEPTKVAEKTAEA